MAPIVRAKSIPGKLSGSVAEKRRRRSHQIASKHHGELVRISIFLYWIVVHVKRAFIANLTEIADAPRRSHRIAEWLGGSQSPR